jgi:hypothetical protein
LITQPKHSGDHQRFFAEVSHHAGFMAASHYHQSPPLMQAQAIKAAGGCPVATTPVTLSVPVNRFFAGYASNSPSDWPCLAGDVTKPISAYGTTKLPASWPW